MKNNEDKDMTRLVAELKVAAQSLANGYGLNEIQSRILGSIIESARALDLSVNG